MSINLSVCQYVSLLVCLSICVCVSVSLCVCLLVILFHHLFTKPLDRIFIRDSVALTSALRMCYCQLVSFNLAEICITSVI